MSDAHRDEIAKLESLYEQNPEGRIFTHLAEAYRKGGELDRAREVLAEGIERHPDYSSAHVVLGRVLIDQDRGDEAESAFRRVLELDPHNLIAIRSLGDLARARGDREEALVHYQRLLDQEPGEGEVRDIVEEMTAAGESGAGEPAPAGGAGPDDSRWMEGASDGPEAPTEPPASGADEPAGLGSLTDEGDAEVRTETIAQVYARQGLYDRAAEVYRELIRSRPDDDGLRERLAEMEQLAEAQAATDGEVDAVSDFGDTEPERLPGLESTPELEAPSDASEEPSYEPAEYEPEEPEESEEYESEERPSSEWVGGPIEGLETGEVDAGDMDAAPLPGLEMDESDPETGLRADVGSESAGAGEDLSEEFEVTDVPEPPEEAPWGGALAVESRGLEDEPAGAGASGDEAVEAPESESVESVWAGDAWSEDVEEASTPHAWTEDEEEGDASPPIRDYFSGLLSWSGSGADAGGPTDGGPTGRAEGVRAESAPAERAAAESGPAGDAPAGDAPADGGATESGAAESGAAESGAAESGAAGSGAAPETGGDRPAGRKGRADDDDLEMFRSWLESLKQ